MNMVNLPDLSLKYHIVKIEPIITTNFVTFITVKHCNADVVTRFPSYSGSESKKPPGLETCSEIIGTHVRLALIICVI